MFPCCCVFMSKSTEQFASKLIINEDIYFISGQKTERTPLN